MDQSTIATATAGLHNVRPSCVSSNTINLCLGVYHHLASLKILECSEWTPVSPRILPPERFNGRGHATLLWNCDGDMTCDLLESLNTQNSPDLVETAEELPRGIARTCCQKPMHPVLKSLWISVWPSYLIHLDGIQFVAAMKLLDCCILVWPMYLCWGNFKAPILALLALFECYKYGSQSEILWRNYVLSDEYIHWKHPGAGDGWDFGHPKESTQTGADSFFQKSLFALLFYTCWYSLLSSICLHHDLYIQAPKCWFHVEFVEPVEPYGKVC